MIRPYYNLGQRDDGYTYSAQRFGGSRMTPAVRWIMFGCTGVFIVQQMLFVQRTDVYDRFVDLLAFAPASRLGTTRVWQYVTYVFLHDGFWHIFFNMLFFWMIGGLVESRLGTKRFLWLFFLCGITGAVAQAAIFPGSRTIGASASVMGVAAACAMLYPDMTVWLFFLIPIKMRYFLWVLVVLEVFGASSASAATDRVAYFAHLGGLGAGFLFIRYQPQAGRALNTLYYRLRGRFRGFVAGNKITHIDDDEKYREEVDRLLDKIFKEGTQSLTSGESEFLKRQSDKFKQQQ
jgi:membrane associated rhomboid family serine protease